MHAVWIVFLFAAGACAGSFLNVVIYRLPRGESIVFPSSHCPRCGRAIRWYDNVPIASWLILRGRCRFCKGRISPRYLVIELLAGLLVAGLYICYFVLRLRDGIGAFQSDWPVLASHAVLLCGLLAASAVDIESLLVPLPVMWVCAGVGIVAAALRPHPTMPPASAPAAAAGLAAVTGLVLGRLLVRYQRMQPSFLDADDRPPPACDKDAQAPARAAPAAQAGGVNPRVEILRELLFLAPAIALGAGAYLAASRLGTVHRFLDSLLAAGGSGPLPGHLASAAGALVGMLIGAAWIWGTRIVGTLTFGREAMGMGDVHILAAVGAVAGWKVASLTFFAAPVFGLIWALYLLFARGRREVPYGPWLALGTLATLVFFDGIVGRLFPAG